MKLSRSRLKNSVVLNLIFFLQKVFFSPKMYTEIILGNKKVCSNTWNLDKAKGRYMMLIFSKYGQTGKDNTK